ncbi:hypothetical protein D3Z35_15965 [Enterococcus faecalis]|uniref:hypothetical protein n=1 Tax=Enterococcus faecalis TaxID=1351 RepID=UPI00080C4FC9|nr:hypothetical protein [Enterococcus faecalis]ANU72140.1 hypothetical protein A4V06_03335 [Enterococcus faecalis]ASU26835.1 hypothetical protein ADH73_12710 [Enterococcus faecalis]MCO8259908.1 hypothetical protein [Enterococcus faecalis]MCP8907939.1 hypothetical protein [Enterococcus faecalis]MCP8910987.1 hypothetical protein [Enterococcus faecalis]
MTPEEKIIYLLNHPLISGYSIERMSNGRLTSKIFRRYRNLLKEVNSPERIFDKMTCKIKKVFLETEEEVLQVDPKTKQEIKEMVKNYSYTIGEF